MQSRPVSTKPDPIRNALPAVAAVAALVGVGALAVAPDAQALPVAARFVGPGDAWTDPANWSPLRAAAPDNDAIADLQFDVTIATPECPAGGVVLSGAGSPTEIDRLTLAAGCRLEIGPGDELRVLREATLGGAVDVEGGKLVVLGVRSLAGDALGSEPIALSARDGGTLDLALVDRYAAPHVELTAHDGTLRMGGVGRSTTISIELTESPGGPGAALSLKGIVQILGSSRLVASSSDVSLSGWLRHDQTDPANLDLSSATVTTGRRATIEPAGLDVGTDCSLLPDANFGIGQLVVGGVASGFVEFRNSFDNGRRGGAHPSEAVYLFGPGTGDPCARTGGDGLVIAPGSRLIVDPSPLVSSVYAYQASTDAFVRLNDLVAAVGPACVPAFGGEVCRPYWIFEDFDTDGIEHGDDNCSALRNGASVGSPQLDADGDGYGDACDTDYDQNGVTTAGDFGRFLQRFGRPGDRQDHNGDGYVTAADFGTYLQKFLRVGAANGPGATALVCASLALDVADGDAPCEPTWLPIGFPFP